MKQQQPLWLIRIDRMTNQAINLAQKLDLFSDLWSPKIIANFNDYDVMVVKAKGEFNWHSHPDSDDFFLVMKGNLRIEMRDGDVVLGPGEMFIVPKNIEHRPVAEDEVQLLLIEPKGTPNTGDKDTAAIKTNL